MWRLLACDANVAAVAISHYRYALCRKSLTKTSPAGRLSQKILSQRLIGRGAYVRLRLFQSLEDESARLADIVFHRPFADS
jgi:hypothetical protein